MAHRDVIMRPESLELKASTVGNGFFEVQLSGNYMKLIIFMGDAGSEADRHLIVTLFGQLARSYAGNFQNLQVRTQRAYRAGLELSSRYRQ
jgi:hypothetical protein